MNRTVCQGRELFALCEQQKRGEITIFSIARGKTNCEWIVNWSRVPNQPMRQVEFDLGMQREAA